MKIAGIVTAFAIWKYTDRQTNIAASLPCPRLIRQLRELTFRLTRSATDEMLPLALVVVAHIP